MGPVDKLTYLQNFKGTVAGADEAGRGPLAGPVVGAAVVLTDAQKKELLALGLRDSKEMTPQRREELFSRMCETGVVWRAQAAGTAVVEALNIARASLWAMGKSVLKLSLLVDLVVVDGLQTLPGLLVAQLPLVKADDLVPAVSAASVVAKVLRDRVMTALDRLYPQYGFARHKGYPTREHRDAVRTFGLSPVHRAAFCKKLLSGTETMERLRR